VRGSDAKKNKETGEIWEEDKSGHCGGKHYEVYKNQKEWEKGRRDRAVSPKGKLLKKF
jgi:hypothetical protein